MKRSGDQELYIETPLILSDPLSRLSGTNVYLKMEALQPSGSFKNRGIGHYCSQSVSDGAKEFVCSSGGNAGLAAAFAARQLNVPITVVVPQTTPSTMVDRIRDQRATVIQHGKDWQEADSHTQKLCEEREACYVPPFDHPLIWDGNATLIHEAASTGLKPDAVIVAVGGGGLLCGVVQGMHNVGWVNIPVYAVETEGAASFAAALDAGEVVEIAAINTVAKSLGARAVAEKALEWARRHSVHSKVVSDSAAVRACQRFAEEHRLLVEPACGAALSLVTAPDGSLRSYNNILVVVCGGACVTPELLRRWSFEV